MPVAGTFQNTLQPGQYQKQLLPQQLAPQAYPTAGTADTTNLGYRGPTNSGFMWNSTPQMQQAPLPGTQNAGGLGGAYSLQDLVNMQMGANISTRQQNQNNWDQSKNFLQGLPGQYAGQQSTQNADRLSNTLAQNPLSLSPQVVQQMKNETANQIQAQSDNSLQQQMGALAAGGQSDASTIAAAKQAQSRAAMGAQATQNTNIDIEAAKQRTQDLTNAANVSRGQSAQDIAPALNVGNSIISHLPQVRPDDYSGLLALSNQMQQQQFQDSLLSRGQNNLKTPIAMNPIGGKYNQNQGGQPPMGNGGVAQPYDPVWMPNGAGPNTTSIKPQFSGNYNEE